MGDTDVIDDSNFRSLKIHNLERAVSRKETEDAICEKFTGFNNVKVTVSDRPTGVRVAYLNFESHADAQSALEKHKSINLFGSDCSLRAIYTNEKTSRYYPDKHVGRGRGFRGRFSARGARGMRHAAGDNEAGRRVDRSPVDRHSADRDCSPPSNRQRGDREQSPYYDRHPKDDYDEHDRVGRDYHGGTGSFDGGRGHGRGARTATSDSNEPNRNLFVGGIDRNLGPEDIRRIFSRFGEICDVEMKRGQKQSFAFVKFLNMDMATRAKNEMAKRRVGSTVPRLGYGQRVETACVWVGGLGPWASVEKIREEFSQFGIVKQVVWPDDRDYAYVLFEERTCAVEAQREMSGAVLGNHRIHTDFVETRQMHEMMEKCQRERQKRELRGRSRSESPREKARKPWSPDRNRHQRSSSGKRSRSNRSYSRSPVSRMSNSPKRRHRRRRSHSSSRSVGSAILKRDMSPISSESQSENGSASPVRFASDARKVVLVSESNMPTQPIHSGYTSVMHPIPTPMPPYGIIDPSIVPPYPPPPFFSIPGAPPVFPSVPPVPVSFGMHANPSLPVMPPVSYSSLPAEPVYVPGMMSNQPAGPASMHPAHAEPATVTTNPVSDICSRFPKVWSGALVLKNSAFVTNMHLVSGSVLLIDSLLSAGSGVSDADCPVLKIMQRLRLDLPDKLDELDQRLRQAGRAGCSILLAAAAAAQVDDVANVIQQRPLGSLVAFLKQKEVAAIVPLASVGVDGTRQSGVLHAFPACQFVTSFLKREAPELGPNCPTDDQLLIIVVKD